MATTQTQAYVARPATTGTTLETVHLAAPGPHELLVDIAAASVCHTDVRAAQGTFHLGAPLILGHEGAGIVRSTGSAVSYVQPGDRVVLSYASCGMCRRCVGGKNAYCDELMPVGFGGRRYAGLGSVKGEGEVVVRDEKGELINGLFFGQSSMSRVALVHESACVKVGAATTKEELKLFASLGCGIQTGAGAILNIAKPEPGSGVAIFGAGAVGLSALLAAALFSPATLVLIDNSAAKLAMIPKEILSKATHVVNPNDLPTENPNALAEHLQALSPDGKGLDVCLDCVGHESILVTGHAALAKMGTLITIGGNSEAKASFKVEHHLVKGITYRGTHQGDSVSRVMIPQIIELWRRGVFPFEKMLAIYGFEELEKALEETHAGKVIKPVLVM
ncbi:hypothetical protein MBLNU230_g2218t1 [Neophaeotheca triangularis]